MKGDLVPKRFMVFQMHGETFDIPRGAELVCRGERVAHQALSWGSALGFQFHLELFQSRSASAINTGVVALGNMGSARRLSYTVLGSAVNLAQRLESNAPVEGILISQRTYELVKDHVPTRALGEITVKGINQPMPVYEVIVNGTGPQ